MSLFNEADAESLRRDRVVLVAKNYLGKVDFSDDFLLGKIIAAEADVARQLKAPLEPTTIFPYAPSEAEIAGLDGKPWMEEPGYDYDPEFFQANRFGYIITRQRPIVSVEFVRFAYPSPQNQVFAIPNDWLRIDKKYGHVRLVPAGTAFAAPLGAFLLQALGGGSTIPAMIQVKYVAGLTDARKSWPDLIDVILKKAVLGLLGDAFVPGSASVSADGLSRSVAVDLAKYEEIVAQKLFGPKGSNGGLWTAIHGVGGTVLGVV